MLLNYLLIPATIISLLYIYILVIEIKKEIKKLYQEIHYLRKDIENFNDETIESINYKK